MKTVLLFTAACALVCATYAAPSGGRSSGSYEAQKENELAKDQFRVTLYDQNKLMDMLAKRGKELAQDQFVIHLYDQDANQLQDTDAERKAKEQFHIRLYNQKDAKEQDEEAASAKLLFFGRLLESLLE